MIPPSVGICLQAGTAVGQGPHGAGLAAPTASPHKPALCREGLGKASPGKGTGRGVTDRQPLPGAPVPAPAGTELRCPGMGRSLRGERTPQRGFSGVPRPAGGGGGPHGRPLQSRGGRGASLLGWGKTDRGQTDRGQGAVLCPFPVRSLPTKAALSQPAAPGAPLGRDPVGREPEDPSEGTRWKGDLAAPPGSGQDAAPGRRCRAAGAEGSREHRESDGAGAGQERGSGSQLPGSHSPLEHAGSRTGRPLRCWTGLPAVRALLSALFLLLLLFFFFSLLFPFSLPSLSEVEPRGMAEQVG